MADTLSINGVKYDVTAEQRAIIEGWFAGFKRNLKRAPDYPANSIGCHPDPNGKALKELKAKTIALLSDNQK